MQEKRIRESTNEKEKVNENRDIQPSRAAPESLGDVYQFCRNLPSSKLMKASGSTNVIDPITSKRWIEDFKLKIGDIVLEVNGRQVKRSGHPAIHVRTATGEEGLVWSRRLQKLENAFGLKERFCLAQTIEQYEDRKLNNVSLTTLRDLAEQRGLLYQNRTRVQLITSLRRYFEHRTRLRVFKISEDHLFTEPGPDVFFERG